MPIHVVLGKPGSGKSLYATGKLIQELANGTRNVVTNLPLRMPALNEYLQKRYPDRDCRALQRVRRLRDEEIRHFWRFRAVEDEPLEYLFHVATEANKDRRKQMEDAIREWSEKPILPKEGDPGVAYFLDEAQIAFNAREWAALGKACLFYLSQHRKLGDVVWPITQAPGNLDKQFRSVAEDFSVLRNEYTAKFGPFRGRGRFVRKSYWSEPQGKGSEPYESATFTLDTKGIAACYDTAQGIGVHGTQADIGRRAKGIPILWVIPMMIGIASLAGIVPYVLGKGAGWWLTDTGKAKHAAAAGDLAKSKPGAAPGQAAAAPATEAAEKPLHVVGYAGSGRGGFVLWLSDGTMITEQDGVVAELTRTHVRFRNGSVLPIRRPMIPTAPIAAAGP